MNKIEKNNKKQSFIDEVLVAVSQKPEIILEDIYIKNTDSVRLICYQTFNLLNCERNVFRFELPANDESSMPSIRKKIPAATPLEEQLECLESVRFKVFGSGEKKLRKTVVWM